MEINILELFDWKTLTICALITTFAVSVINLIQEKLSSNKLIAIVAFVITILSTSFDLPSILDTSFDLQKIIAYAQKLGLQVVTTMAFAVLFYNYIGQFTIDRLFAWIKKQIDNKLGKDDPTG